jgi:Fis family transcriptional regulator, factor for inversion stimulation protein
MNQATISAEFDIGVMPPIVDTALSNATTLRDSVRAAAKEYLIKLDGMEPANVYELFLAEVELPLLEMTLKYSNNNQSKTARMLKLSRSTLRKKIHQYGLLKSKRKKL